MTATHMTVPLPSKPPFFSSSSSPCPPTRAFHLRECPPPSLRPFLCVRSVAKTTHNASQLHSKFGSDRVRFMDVGGMTVLEVKVETGTNLRLLLHEARVTSFKYKMWHGGLEELLQTDVSDAVSSAGSEAQPGFVINGGMFPTFSLSGVRICEGNWRLESIKEEPQKYVQITLGCDAQNEDGSKLYLQDVVTLSNTILASAVLVINKGKKPLTFTGSVTSHLSVKSAEAVCSVGLHGCSYYSPSQAAQNGIGWGEDGSFLGKLKKFAWPSQQVERTSENEDAAENEQTMGRHGRNSVIDDPKYWFTEKNASAIPLSKGIRKLYRSPPSGIRITDEGFRRSVVIDRRGFDNLELYSPEVDGENPFIAVGCGSVISPVLLEPRAVWKGAQVLIPD